MSAPRAGVGIPTPPVLKHARFRDQQKCENFIVRNADGLLLNLKLIRVPAVEPSVSANLARHVIVCGTPKEYAERETLGVKFCAWKPALWDIICAGKPSTALRTVGNEHRGKLATVHETNCRGSYACIGHVGDHLYVAKIEPRISPHHRSKKIPRHQQICCVTIRRPLRQCLAFASSANLVTAAYKNPVTMVSRVPQLMSERKALPPKGARKELRQLTVMIAWWSLPIIRASQPSSGR